MKYTPPPEPMTDRQFYIVAACLVGGFAGAAVIMAALTWLLVVFAR